MWLPGLGKLPDIPDALGEIDFGALGVTDVDVVTAVNTTVSNASDAMLGVRALSSTMNAGKSA